MDQLSQYNIAGELYPTVAHWAQLWEYYLS